MNDKTNKPNEINNLLNKTKRIWSKGDALKYQNKIRSEWKIKIIRPSADLADV